MVKWPHCRSANTVEMQSEWGGLTSELGMAWLPAADILALVAAYVVLPA